MNPSLWCPAGPQSRSSVDPALKRWAIVATALRGCFGLPQPTASKAFFRPAWALFIFNLSFPRLAPWAVLFCRFAARMARRPSSIVRITCNYFYADCLSGAIRNRRVSALVARFGSTYLMFEAAVKPPPVCAAVAAQSIHSVGLNRRAGSAAPFKNRLSARSLSSSVLGSQIPVPTGLKAGIAS
jgi:hypothetical protein